MTTAPSRVLKSQGGSPLLSEGNLRILLLVTVGLGFFLVIARVVTTVKSGFGLSDYSGAWVALAEDLKNGIFYRPLNSGELGFGGTRYFPFYFVLLSLFMSVFSDPWIAGCALNVLSVIILISGLAAFFRQLEVDWKVLAILSFLPLLTLSVHAGIDTIRCDSLAAGLSIWGLWAFIRWERKKVSLFVVSLIFSLAFATKMTCIFGPFASFAYLALRRSRTTWRLGASVGIGFVVVLLVMYVGSNGRILEILKTCAGGDVTLASAFKSPWTFISTLVTSDTANFLIFFAAALSFFVLPRSEIASLPFLSVFAVILQMLVTFTSPGVWINHFVDLQVASLLLLGWVLTADERMDRRVVLGGLLFAALFGLVSVFRLVVIYDPLTQNRSDLSEVNKVIGLGSKPVLSEDPMIPILTGEKVFATDLYMIRIINQVDPRAREKFFRDIQQANFRAIVLIRDPYAAGDWYDVIHFGPGFLSSLRENYVLKKQIGDYRVYVPSFAQDHSHSLD